MDNKEVFGITKRVHKYHIIQKWRCVFYSLGIYIRVKYVDIVPLEGISYGKDGFSKLRFVKRIKRKIYSPAKFFSHAFEKADA